MQLKSIVAGATIALIAGSMTPRMLGLEAYNAELDRLARLLEIGAINQETFARATARLRDELEGESELASDLGSALTNAFDDAIAGADSFRDVLKNLARDLSRIGQGNEPIEHGSVKLITADMAGDDILFYVGLERMAT